ncbi:inner-membrane translocator [Solidesulfovibrio carbinoliphilus subsp. oakridgensis]|uniref:Inner-membrane translocator n=1 Tax=Solidesulfovibrio carbinoliphilus subsp. oakridgensis TaxID=694327 RepID=G7Q5C6_9BACT|nr:branched-chain amino acid ABC transporter permease [Solidesulfovibrio carbinoliphilus]EHJ48927.1 inner-membrane translocator [Solidesulfovibrio carbinoliphilus subsp. oakridgensis]
MTRPFLGRNSIQAAFFLALLLGLPYALPNEYYLSICILGCLSAVIAVGLNLLMGYAGQISLGHAAFYGIGAYVTAIATTRLGLPIPVGMGLGVGLAALVAWIVAAPTLKLKGHYLAMATLGFGIIVSIVFNEAVDWTGGPSGYVGIPRLALFGYSFDSDHSYYNLMAVVLALVVLGALNLMKSRTGRALRALHVSEKAAASLGVDISAHKRFVFVLSAALAGLAGVLYAHYLSFIAPASFGFTFSVQLVVMVVLGGMASVWGSVAGAFFLTILPEALREFEDIDILVYGAILVATIMFLPDGLAGGAGRLLRKLRRPGGRHDG